MLGSKVNSGLKEKELNFTSNEKSEMQTESLLPFTLINAKESC